MVVKTRMAPSPTGEYHIGHIRTVLYNWAFARKKKGKFLLRIEDTDRERYVEGAEERILAVIKDYGFDWDEGPDVGGDNTPYFQSQRLDIYHEYIKELVEKDKAYYCFCTKERLAQLREQQKSSGIPPKYDKKCLSLSASDVKEKLDSGEPYVLRLNVPADEEISFEDRVYSYVSVNTNDIDDQVLIKSDGFPTYHFAVVVDDHLMNVTHVMRGNDWIPSTSKHILLYRAFGWDVPVYAHLPNLKEKGDSKKLSKRFGSVFAREFLEEGYLPEAINNFLMFLGWNPGVDREIYTLNEFVEEFSIEKIHKTDLVSFDRDKLLWFNGYYIRNCSSGELWEKIKVWSKKFGVDLGVEGLEDTYVERVVSLVQERMKLLSEFKELSYYFFETPEVDKDLLVKQSGDDNLAREILESYLDLFKNVSYDNWNADYLDEISHNLLEEKGYKAKDAFMTLRVAVSGVTATPPLFDVLEVLGKEEVLRRLKIVLK